ncbi:MAG: Flp/Fap pilin component [Hyphomicrobiales bacterium]|nr:Flp/Fap pilin component [Hyphomicrobiales bacterium]
MTKLLLFITKDTRGAAALEYCIIAALISILVVAGAASLGTGLRANFTTVSSGLT